MLYYIYLFLCMLVITPHLHASNIGSRDTAYIEKNFYSILQHNPADATLDAIILTLENAPSKRPILVNKLKAALARARSCAAVPGKQKPLVRTLPAVKIKPRPHTIAQPAGVGIKQVSAAPKKPQPKKESPALSSEPRSKPQKPQEPPLMQRVSAQPEQKRAVAESAAQAAVPTPALLPELAQIPAQPLVSTPITVPVPPPIPAWFEPLPAPVSTMPAEQPMILPQPNPSPSPASVVQPLPEQVHQIEFPVQQQPEKKQTAAESAALITTLPSASVEIPAAQPAPAFVLPHAPVAVHPAASTAPSILVEPQAIISTPAPQQPAKVEPEQRPQHQAPQTAPVQRETKRAMAQQSVTAQELAALKAHYEQQLQAAQTAQRKAEKKAQRAQAAQAAAQARTAQLEQLQSDIALQQLKQNLPQQQRAQQAHKKPLDALTRTIDRIAITIRTLQSIKNTAAQRTELEQELRRLQDQRDLIQQGTSSEGAQLMVEQAQARIEESIAQAQAQKVEKTPEPEELEEPMSFGQWLFSFFAKSEQQPTPPQQAITQPTPIPTAPTSLRLRLQGGPRFIPQEEPAQQQQAQQRIIPLQRTLEPPITH